MKSEKWQTLKTWHSKNWKSLPSEVQDAIGTLIDERETEDDDEYDEDEENEQ